MHPIDLNNVKCRISEGCFFALGSYARYKLEKVAQENDCGTDFRLIRQIERNGRISDNGCILEFQLKATEKWVTKDGNIKLKLSSKSFNDIVMRNVHGGTPLIVVVMLLSKGKASWLNIKDQEIIFREKLYWYHTTSTSFLSNNNSTTTISVPCSNLLNEKAFHQIVASYGMAKLAS